MKVQRGGGAEETGERAAEAGIGGVKEIEDGRGVRTHAVPWLTVKVWGD